MNKRWILTIALGVLAAGANFAWATGLKNEAVGGEKVKVAVASRSLKKGDTLDSNNLGVRMIPAAYVDERVVRGKRTAEIMNLPVAVALKSGQVIQWTDFERREDAGESDLANHVEAGKRAMTIPVNSSLSLGGLLRPGHRVDILATFAKGRRGEDERRSVTLLQNVTVLATGDNVGVDDGKRRFGTVTMSVTVEQGELLAFASEIGSLSLVLRGYQDLSVTRDIPAVGKEDIFAPERGVRPLDGKHLNLGIERLKVSR